MAVGAYTTALLWTRSSRCRPVVCSPAAARDRAGRDRSSARPPRGCAGRTSPARRSRSRSACRRWPTATTRSSAATTASRSSPPTPPLVARRDLPAASAGRRGSPAPARSVTYVLLANLVRSRYGRTWRAVRDDEVAAAVAGLHVGRRRSLAFVVSAACAGLAGGLFVVVTCWPRPARSARAVDRAAHRRGARRARQPAGAMLGRCGDRVRCRPSADDLSRALSLPTQGRGATSPLAVYGIVLIVAMLAAPQGIQGAGRAGGGAGHRTTLPRRRRGAGGGGGHDATSTRSCGRAALACSPRWPPASRPVAAATTRLLVGRRRRRRQRASAPGSPTTPSPSAATSR